MESLKIGIAGLGTVGQGVHKILTEHKDLITKRAGREIEIVAVSARDKSKDRGIDVSNLTWYDNAVDLTTDENVDVVIELIGGAEGIAKDLVESALKGDQHVVTANKALIAKAGFELAQYAEENDVALQFEASVAGGIPIIKAMKEGLSANKVTKVMGILNGTCNFIIDVMETQERSFNDVLKEAQELGYAEADPSFDIDGIDAAHKLVILTSLAFGTKPNFDALYAEGITKVTLNDIKYAEHFGYAIKLLAIAEQTEDGKISQRVHPCVINKEADVAGVNGVLGAVKVKCDALGDALFTGAGAGMMPTASAVVADIIDIARTNYIAPFTIKTEDLVEGDFNNMDSHKAEYYIRFNVKDVDGVLSSITSVLSNHKIGFEKLHQDLYEEGKANLVVITHEENEKDIKAALAEINTQDYILNETIFFRVEEV